MRRFIFDLLDYRDGEVLLSEEESRHVSRVLRLKSGEKLVLLDGQGGLYQGKIRELGRRVRVCEVVRMETAGEERFPRVYVYQCLIKSAKMELLVQKCSELGAVSLTPVLSSRCQGGRERGLQNEKKRSRYERIAEESCKQSGRAVPLSIGPIEVFDELVAGLDMTKSLGLLFWERERDHGLSSGMGLETSQEIHILLGPEGGFSDQEVELAGKHGWMICGLGPLVLRAETACIAALSVVQYLTAWLR